MARIRTIKPQFFLNEEIAKMGPLDRILFIGLWTLADRSGRLEDRPTRIKIQILPYDDHDIDSALSRLSAEKFIIRYEVQGERFIEIINFIKHQHCHIKEPESTIPEPGKHRAKPSLARQEGKGREQEGKGKEKEEPGAKTSAFVLPEWINPSAWTGFEEMRRKIKKPMTDRARANIVTKLAAFKAKGHDPTKILDNSITNSWQDVYEPKQETRGHDRKSFDQIERERQERIREESRRKIGMGGTGLVPSRSNQPSSLGIGGSQGALPGTDSETAAIEDQADG